MLTLQNITYQHPDKEILLRTLILYLIKANKLRLSETMVPENLPC